MPQPASRLVFLRLSPKDAQDKREINASIGMMLDKFN